PFLQAAVRPARHAPYGGAACKRDPVRQRLAIRAEVGRLPLSCLPRWRFGRALLEIGQAARTLLSGNRCRIARPRRATIRARWRVGPACRGLSVLRRSAAPSAPGPVPNRAALS